MASWQEAAAVAPARTRHPRPKSKPRPTPRRRPKAKARAGVAGGVAWIVVAGVLLAGIVALNVAVLRLNVKLDRLNNERQQLHAGNAAIASQLSSAAASPRIQNLAQKRLGLVPADPSTTTFVDLSRTPR
jgi:cell division protein FtsL